MALPLSAREGGDLGARIDAHPSIRQQVALKLANGRQRSKPLQAAGSGGFTAMDGGLGSADYAVRGMTGNGASHPLALVPAKVSCPNRLRSLGPWTRERVFVPH